MPAEQFVDVFIFNIVSTDKIFAHVCANDYSVSVDSLPFRCFMSKL